MTCELSYEDNYFPVEELCNEVSPRDSYYFCSRERGHTGEHHAHHGHDLSPSSCFIIWSSTTTTGRRVSTWEETYNRAMARASRPRRSPVLAAMDEATRRLNNDNNTIKKERVEAKTMKKEELIKIRVTMKDTTTTIDDEGDTTNSAYEITATVSDYFLSVLNSFKIGNDYDKDVIVRTGRTGDGRYLSEINTTRKKVKNLLLNELPSNNYDLTGVLFSKLVEEKKSFTIIALRSDRVEAYISTLRDLSFRIMKTKSVLGDTSISAMTTETENVMVSE